MINHDLERSVGGSGNSKLENTFIVVTKLQGPNLIPTSTSKSDRKPKNVSQQQCTAKNSKYM